MPRHAISADHVEAALPLARMAEAIATLARGEPLDLGG
jgi:chemotaxis response regulator CheB